MQSRIGAKGQKGYYRGGVQRGRITGIINYWGTTIGRDTSLIRIAAQCVLRIRHPKYLHCPVARFKSNRFEMTFHLTLGTKGRDRTRPGNARAHPLLCGITGQCSVLSRGIGLYRQPGSRTISMDHPAASRNIAL